MSELAPAEREASESKFVWLMVAIAVVLAALPAVIGWLSGSNYVGYQYNTDDHMVYAAWMRQAMDGHFFFDNRFTTDPQPGLTVHLYFFLLGLVAKVTGIALAATLARLGFSALFIWLVYRLARKLGAEVYVTKLAVALTIVGGGVGFLVWHTFGQAIVKPSPLSGPMLGRLPTDVWQPEGFVFPSMLTNALFMVSLCLIVGIFLAFLAARDTPKAILPGAVAIGVLMNIHSYDVLMVGLVMVGFLGATLVQRQVTHAWTIRCVLIVLGVVPAALWFVHVLKNDPVFQSRAATETYSPNFRQVVFGYLLLMILGLAGAAFRASGSPGKIRRLAGIAIAAALFLAMFVLAGGHTDGYFMGAGPFTGIFLAAVAAVALASDENPAWNLVFSWVVIGTVAIYFPGLFQRKLAMGLSIPWAILSAYGLHGILRNQPRSTRNLALTLSILLLGASSAFWLIRERQFIAADVANTGRHPVYLSPDAKNILDYLNHQPGKKVVLALPGVSNPVVDQTTGQPIPDELGKPLLPDLAPFTSGLTGAYTYAGHWSETPKYGERAGDMYRFFLREPFQSVHRVMTDGERVDFERMTGANYAILPVQEAYPQFPLVSPEMIGAVVVPGTQFCLVRLK
jgi:arabinosyltransferase C